MRNREKEPVDTDCLGLVSAIKNSTAKFQMQHRAETQLCHSE